MRTRPRFRRLLALAGTLVAGLAMPGAASAAPSIYWGANVGDHLTGGAVPYDMTAADAFESMVGKQMSLIEFSLPFMDCKLGPCDYRTFPTTLMEAIRARGALPVFGWASYSQPLSLNQPSFRLARIIDGTHDAFIRQWARDARAWGYPFFLVFNWEMNLRGLWPYGEADNGNQSGEYAQAWRHVHDIFTQEGATNATWVWCPNTIYDTYSGQIAGLYPGDAYVDWTCIDGYKWPWSSLSFADLFGPTYDRLQAIAPDKPVLIGETAASEKGGSKANWITETFNGLPTRFPNIKGFVWFEKVEPGLAPEDPRSWLVETSPSSLAAFRNAIASAAFAGPGLGPASGKIPPLTPVVPAPSPAPGPNPGPNPNPGPDPTPAKSCWVKPYSTTAACRRGPMIGSLATNSPIRRTLRDPGIGAAKDAEFRFRTLADGWVTVRFQRRTAAGRWRTLKDSLTLPVTQGRRGLSFSGRVSRTRTLQAGRYRAIFGGRDRSGRTARTIRATFVLRR